MQIINHATSSRRMCGSVGRRDDSSTWADGTTPPAKESASAGDVSSAVFPSEPTACFWVAVGVFFSIPLIMFGSLLIATRNNANGTGGGGLRFPVPDNSPSAATTSKPLVKPITVVQIGDSMSAGNGAGEYVGIPACYQSTRNWGNVFASELRNRGEYNPIYVNRACSGAQSIEVVGRQVIDMTPITETGGKCPSPTWPAEEGYEKILHPTVTTNTTTTNNGDSSVVKCAHYVKPQIDAVSTHVDMVLLTIGANDLNFPDIVQSCYAGSFISDPTSCKRDVDAALDGLPALRDRIIQILLELRERMPPDARVVLVAYPHITMDVPHVLTDGPDIRYDATPNVRNLVLDVSNIQKAAVNAANSVAGKEFVVFFNDTIELFAGHEPHPGQSKENPNGWFVEMSGGDRAVSIWVHRHRWPGFSFSPRYTTDQVSQQTVVISCSYSYFSYFISQIRSVTRCWGRHC